MKKIGILTINDDSNYGNRLQNYAIQEIFKKFDIIPETINNQNNIVYLNVLKKKIKYIIKKIINLKKHRRYISFIDFNKKINYSKYYIDEKHIIKNLSKKYDLFFTGSDQVWNPTFNRLTNIDLLTFAKDEQKISFSASFGISELPEQYKEKAKKALKTFKMISVREDRGKEIIEELTGRNDVKVLVDPTMLLSAEEWDKVLKRPKPINLLNEKKYILNYFLGNLSEQRKTEIERIAKENDCEIINILDEKDPFFVSGPSEFLYLEKNAFLICTDSFHSSVFAILYNRPFVIFDREQEGVEKMNSRIDTLISKFNLKNRKYNGSKITKENLEHDYTEAYKILEEERKKANSFLKKALNIEEE